MGLDIGVDLDGVCYDFPRAFREWVAHRTGRRLSDLAEPTCWEFFTAWGLSLEEFLELFHEGVDAGWIYGRGAPFPGTREALASLSARGHRLHVVTDRGAMGSPGAAQESTRRWLHAEGIVVDSLTVAKDKTVVPTDVFIEDLPANAQDLVGAGRAVVLLDRSWNQGFTAPGVVRVGCWAEVLGALEQFESAAREL
jgi:uncharacterized HAD superfamily protein